MNLLAAKEVDDVLNAAEAFRRWMSNPDTDRHTLEAQLGVASIAYQKTLCKWESKLCVTHCLHEEDEDASDCIHAWDDGIHE